MKTILNRLPLLVLILILAIPASLTAQDSVDEAAAAATELAEGIAGETAEDTPPRWETSLAVGGGLTRGNSETLGLNLSLTSVKATEKNEWAWGVLGNYGETEGETSTETGSLYYNYKRMFGSSFLYSDSELFHDKIALISYRLTSSLGWGRYVIDNERTKLGLELGVAFIREDFEEIPEGEAVDQLEADNIFALRFAETFEHQLSETAKIWQSIEYLPEVSDFGNYLLTATAGIEAAISAKLSLRLALEDRYDSEPPPGAEKNDLSTVVALAFRL